MGSTLSVTTLQGLTSGNDANKIYVPSGHTLHAPGHVLQTVNHRFATNTTMSATSYADTGVTADITIQEGSKILVILNLASGQLYGSSNMGMYQNIVINGSIVEECHFEMPTQGYFLSNHNMQYLSGAYSAGTYTVKSQVRSVNAAWYFRFNWTSVGASSIILQEIAQ